MVLVEEDCVPVVLIFDEEKLTITILVRAFFSAIGQFRLPVGDVIASSRLVENEGISTLV